MIVYSSHYLIIFKDFFNLDRRIKLILGNLFLGLMKLLILNYFRIKRLYGIKEIIDIKLMLTLAYIYDSGNEFKLLMNN